MDTYVELIGYFDDSGIDFFLKVDMEKDNSEPYLFGRDESDALWYSEKEIDQIIKILRKAKHIRKTGTVI